MPSVRTPPSKADSFCKEELITCCAVMCPGFESLKRNKTWSAVINKILLVKAHMLLEMCILSEDRSAEHSAVLPSASCLLCCCLWIQEGNPAEEGRTVHAAVCAGIQDAVTCVGNGPSFSAVSSDFIFFSLCSVKILLYSHLYIRHHLVVQDCGQRVCWWQCIILIGLWWPKLLSLACREPMHWNVNSWDTC